MKKFYIALILSLPVFQVFSQDHGFSYGAVSLRELDMKVYQPDTSAVALVLDEFGETTFNLETLSELFYTYHVRIKILRKEGLSLADVKIPLGRSDNEQETITSIRASSYTRSGNSWRETRMPEKSVITDVISKKSLQYKKFAIPDVEVGSIIEYEYKMKTPFIFNFRNWNFQDEIPKLKSEYWGSFPANYNYSVTLKGYLQLSVHSSEVIKDCVGSSSGIATSGSADCTSFKYGMKDIPAFKREEYMTAASNFISSIHFELMSTQNFDGQIRKYTEEWSDVALRLDKHEDFGAQIRKWEDLYKTPVKELILGEKDPLIQAKKVFDAVKFGMAWNGETNKYAEVGARKANESKTGNVADINFALIGALRAANFDVNPVILSTRENGVPIELYPVMTDYNYVIAQLKIGDNSYLLDASDDQLTFGMLCEDCINGKGRVLSKKGGGWVELKAVDKQKEVTIVNLKLHDDGVIRGKIEINYYGYSAARIRRKLLRYSSDEEYVKAETKQLNGVEIKKHEVKKDDDVSKPVSETYEVEITSSTGDPSHILINPFFFFGSWNRNPFRSSQRSYPVDFGSPLEETLIFNIEMPADFEATDLPDKVATALPNNGGKFLYSAQTMGNRLSLNSAMVISRPVYSPQEYHYLKEMFNAVVDRRNADVLLKKK